MKRLAKLLGIYLHFLFEFNKTIFVHAAKITVLGLLPFIALNVFALFPLIKALLSKRKNLFLINSAQLTTFPNL